MLKKLFSKLSLIAVVVSVAVHAESSLMDHRIDELLKTMSLDEKIGQLNQYSCGMDSTGASTKPAKEIIADIEAGRVGSLFNAYGPSFTREMQELAIKNRKVPLLFAYDVIHGHRTIFPVPLAESSTWNLELIEKTAKISAIEATADGLHWIFGPMVDVARDPRWGRIVEGAGEDAWLGSKIATAKVKGIQGKNLSDEGSALATVKHFAAYGAPLGGRDYAAVDVSEETLYNVYLPPFKAAIEAGSASLMTAFNEINGEPASSNKWLLTDLLRTQWGFKGFIVSDYTSINELQAHAVARDPIHAAQLGFKAGVDMDMQGSLYHSFLSKLVTEGPVLNAANEINPTDKITEADIEVAARRVLEAKYKLGLLDDPHKNSDSKRAAQVLRAPEHLDHALDVARKSIVLLKNDTYSGADGLMPLLPLNKNKTIALIGPMANNQRDQIGSWSAAGDWSKVVTLRQGLETYLKKQKTSAQIIYAKGTNILEAPTEPGERDLRPFVTQHSGLDESDTRSSDDMLNEAVAVAQKSDVIVAALGESFVATGEGASFARLRLPRNQQKLLRKLAETKKPIVLLVFSGRPLVLEQEIPLASSIVQTWYLGHQAGHAIADVLYGEHNPSGKLTASFPYDEGQLPLSYSFKNTGRPINDGEIDKFRSQYRDVPNGARYPFGWGLSYTEFTYGAVSLSEATMRPGEVITAKVKITNSGKRAGEETVQLYIRDVIGSVTRPMLELKGFKKVYLEPGQSAEVQIPIKVDDLKFYRKANNEMVWNAEAGTFKVFMGGNSRELQSAEFVLVK